MLPILPNIPSSQPEPLPRVPVLDVAPLLAEPEVQLLPNVQPKIKKMARSQMRAWVVMQVRKQGGLCPLCNSPIDLTKKGEGVVDHDHGSGLIRGVLCRACNGAEGKVANAAGRWGARSMDYAKIVPFLERLVAYLKKDPLPIMYPFHKTADDKRLTRNKAAREARAAKAARTRLKENQ